MRYLRQMGLIERFAGERPLEMCVAETASGENTLDRMIEVGRELREQDGADSSSWAAPAWRATAGRWRQALGVPVIDPTQAAVAMAIGTVQFATD